jgi:hypothetical protein
MVDSYNYIYIKLVVLWLIGLIVGYLMVNHQLSYVSIIQLFEDSTPDQL